MNQQRAESTPLQAITAQVGVDELELANSFKVNLNRTLDELRTFYQTQEANLCNEFEVIINDQQSEFASTLKDLRQSLGAKDNEITRLRSLYTAAKEESSALSSRLSILESTLEQFKQ